MSSQRPKVTIQFKYNMDTGEIEEFIVDDHASAASEQYHDQVAKAVAGRLGRNPEIADAGLRHNPVSVSGAGTAATGKQPVAQKENNSRE
ncbi:MAG: hypothetical protein JXO49_12575 [Deltaproteobacteria bacterium]|nr:hypothetical protein [Candidatus Anaeroferrophillus wilburensis]MBN2890163.1 hypothetical protein [Deltaproteobacteria bacterium]